MTIDVGGDFMFGHTDDQIHQDAPQPAPDGMLSTDAQAAATAPAIDEHAESNYADTLSAAATIDPAPVIDPVSPSAKPEPSAVEAPAPAHPDNDQLLSIKQQALQQLTPLVGHLEQEPEEKFRTTMMMIQAADNSSLLQTAYDSALQISNEKARAQALLDIVNEINYFTHANSTDTQ